MGDAALAQVSMISVPQQGPDTRLLRNNYQNWEKTLPFAGLSIAFNANDINNQTSIGYYGRGEKELCFSVFDAKKTINYANYSNAIADLKSCKFIKLKNNFMMLSLFNNNWSLWSDDASWAHLLANLSAAAQIAHNSGLKGIILDTEMYGSPQNLDLVFYCQQFVSKMYISNSKIAYVRINNRADGQTIDDLFPKPGDKIYWKGSDDVVDNIKLTKVFLNIYKDNSGFYYYPLIDPKYKDDVNAIIADVKKRGEQIISTIAGKFPDAQVMLTVGPSSLMGYLNIYGLTLKNNPYWTGSGLLIPLVDGMLQVSQTNHVQLIDGQEQTYYFKTQSQFSKAHQDFINSSNYFKSPIKSIYLKNMHEAVGLYARPVASSNGNERFFTPQEITNAFKFAAAVPSLKYVWVYEERESYWFLNTLASRYVDKSKPMSLMGGTAFKANIERIKQGITK